MTIIQTLCVSVGGIFLGIGLLFAALAALSDHYHGSDAAEGCLTAIVVTPLLLLGAYLIIRGILA